MLIIKPSISYTNSTYPDFDTQQKLAVCITDLSFILFLNHSLSMILFIICRKLFVYIMRFDKKSTELPIWQQLISVADEIILKIAKNYFKFANFFYSVRFQWHRL